ncbi:hypothetical protein ACHAW6_004585 [Cyclotella cf. meneghiniana]
MQTESSMANAITNCNIQHKFTKEMDIQFHCLCKRLSISTRVIFLGIRVIQLWKVLDKPPSACLTSPCECRIYLNT